MPRQSIIQRADGRYQCKYGNKYFYGKTQTEAIKKRDAWILEEKKGLDHEKDGLSFQEYALEWIEVFRARTNKPQQKQYINMMEAFSQQLNRKYMRQITSMDIQRICNRKQRPI